MLDDRREKLHLLEELHRYMREKFENLQEHFFEKILASKEDISYIHVEFWFAYIFLENLPKKHLYRYIFFSQEYISGFYYDDFEHLVAIFSNTPHFLKQKRQIE
mgnify:CR=1 FL=1|jgi:hypothetical protein